MGERRRNTASLRLSGVFIRFLLYIVIYWPLSIAYDSTYSPLFTGCTYDIGMKPQTRIGGTSHLSTLDLPSLMRVIFVALAGRGESDQQCFGSSILCVLRTHRFYMQSPLGQRSDEPACAEVAGR